MTILNSAPNLLKFNPNVIPYQKQVMKAIRQEYDYNLGTHEILLSGSVGSAKSILAAHAVVTHCLLNKGARVLLGRKSMPDLKSTIFAKVIEHIELDLIEGEDYWVNLTSASIRFRNGSEVISRSWSDKRYKKVRSLELSAACIEELTENDEDDSEVYSEILMRVGRVPGIHERFLISCTNPDAPSHWAYKHFILSNKETRHTIYSVTSENPFLPESYCKSLLDNLSERMAQRMIYGQWLEISDQVIYSSYTRENNYSESEYKIVPQLPIHIAFDFNIGEGKPFSSCAFQVIGETIHIFDEVIINGARTLDACEEWANKGLLTPGTMYIINGDATGAARTTKSIHSDYDIIKKYFSNYPGIRFEMRVPRANPPIRTRHNLVNAYCKNANGKIRLTVYKKAKTVDEALRLTAFKKGSSIEDDSKAYQHVGTALGYGIVSHSSRLKRVMISTGAR